MIFLSALAIAARAYGAGFRGDTLESSLAQTLASGGLAYVPGSMVWLDPDRGPLRFRSVLFLAARDGGLSDVYSAEVFATRDRTVLDVWLLTNVTRSSGAAEEALSRVDAAHVAFTTRVGANVEALVVLDTRGEDRALIRGWPFVSKIQNTVSNIQETGRIRGFGKVRYGLVTPARDLAVSVQDSRLRVRADELAIEIALATGDVRTGAEAVEVQRAEKARPGLLTWVVDTVRNVSWIGPEPIAWLEHHVFQVKDWFQRKRYETAGSDPEADAAEAVADIRASVPMRALLAAPDPEIGWPPPPLRPILPDAVGGEGEWVSMDGDPFIRRNPNAPMPFVQTFVRADAERKFTRIYVTLWDPRQVQLRAVMGTREPESATGETGPGMIPRAEETLEHVVAAFNGGFQAMHGEFGMMADGRMFLPPKPWAATVAVYQDGRVGVGSWPAPPKNTQSYEEGWAIAQIPADMTEMRQNLTTVLEGDVFNPWERWWWGAAPVNAREQTLTHRTGLCVTREGFMAYFWGPSMSPEALFGAMRATRCERGMHLDMNDRLTHFEFYDAWGPTETRPPLLQRPSESEYEGPFPDASNAILPGWTLRARKAVRSMTPARFPQYAGRNPRDFFYLTLRPVLPGPDVPESGGEPLRFSTAGLPHAGWPHAFARLEIEPGTWLVRIDPRRAVPSPLASPDLTDAIGHLVSVPSSSGAAALYAVRQSVGTSYRIGRAPSGAVVLLRGEPLENVAGASRAIGVDGDGFLVYAERAEESALPLGPSLERVGVRAAIALPDPVRLAFRTDGRAASVDGTDEIPVENSLDFFAETRSAASVLFPETQPRPYRVWGRLQGARVRYFPTGTPRFLAPPTGH